MMLSLRLLCRATSASRITTQIFRQYAKRLGAQNYPERLPTINETAQRLGFENAKEMYPEYPLNEPPELWVITQIHNQKFRPYWEKELMKEMGLYNVHDISIQMNTESVNEKLWQVKHLVKVQPLRFPQGYPTEDDIGETLLKSNGEFVIFKRLEENECVEDESLVPQLELSQWKVVDGYRKCNNCTARRCYKLGMCQKLWFQKGKNSIEVLGPRMYNFVDPKEK